MGFYQYYGLTVYSDLSLPELIVLSEIREHAVDVHINRGHVAKEGLSQGKTLGPFLQAANQQIWLSVPNVARFLIRNGTEIIYDPIANIDDDSIRVFLLGSCTGALLFQRGHLVLHGNAFEVNGGCVICVGKSGAGKSTLAAAMMQRNHRIVADDVCPVDSNGYAIPGMPRIKLWQDSADKLSIDTSGLRRIRPQLEKFNYPLNGSFCKEALPVTAIYILNIHNSTDFKVERIEGMDKYTPLRNNTYRLGYSKGMKLDDQHLRSCSLLAARIRLSRLYRPKGGFQLEELADFILTDMKETHPITQS
jgi:hypothetical protein